MPAYTPAARPPLTPRFTRVREGRVVAGVAAGLSEHLLVDVRFVRLFFTLASLAGGLGALLYLAVWVMTPLAPGGAAPAGTAWPRRVDYLLAAIASAASLATLQVTDGGGSAVTAVLGLVAVGAVLALQAYDRGRGGGGTAAALAAGIVLFFLWRSASAEASKPPVTVTNTQTETITTTATTTKHGKKDESKKGRSVTL